MRFKNISSYIVMALILVAGYAISTTGTSTGASSEFAAKVNGAGIKNVTLEAALNNFIENQKLLGIDVGAEKKEELRVGILEELISAELLYQESKKAKIGNLDKEIDEQFESIKKGFASEEEFRKILKDRGITVKDLKEDIRKGVYIQTFLEQGLYNNITVDEEDKRREYDKNKDKLNVPEQVRVSHILIRTPQDASSEQKENAKKKIDEIRKRALAGEDFAELAKQYSEDGSASRGGDIGYFSRGDMVKPFEEAAFSLESGQISEVVETQFGCHIIKFIDRKDARGLDYKEVAGSIERFLLNQRRTEALDRFVDEIKKNAKIERY